jgi:hypothetical protein
MPESLSTKPLSTKPLSSWREGASRDSIIGFVEQTCGEVTARAVPVEERVAVFDNDGTLWCERPLPIHLDFILRRLVELLAYLEANGQQLRRVRRRP